MRQPQRAGQLGSSSGLRGARATQRQRRDIGHCLCQVKLALMNEVLGLDESREQFLLSVVVGR